MRKLWLLAFLFGLPAFAQSPVIGGAVQYVNTAPSGSCAAAPPIEVLISSGAIYTCDNGTWAAQGGSGGSGTVTSIATTGPISGGTITTTGTLSCPTCVVASSPGLGLAHFAGSTQTVTSSLVAIADLSATGTPSSTTYLRGDNTWATAGGPTAYAPTTYTAYGDSITGCSTGITAPNNCYVNRLGSYLSIGTPTNYGTSGATICGVLGSQILAHDNPTIAQQQPLRTLLAGTNDANSNGTSYVPTFNLCYNAALAWLAIPSQQKAAGSTATTTGTCANDTTYSVVTGENCTSSGATLTYSITTTGEPIYVWYRIINSDAGTWNYALDGGSTVSETTAPSVAIATDVTQSAALIRIPASAATHSLVFSKTNGGGNMSVLAVGTAPTTLEPSNPYVLAGEIPPQQNGNIASTIATFNSNLSSDVSTLSGDGLNLNLAYPGNYLIGTTAAADYYNSLHPNDAGHGELFAAFIAGLPGLVPGTTTNFVRSNGYSQNPQAGTGSQLIVNSNNGNMTISGQPVGTLYYVANQSSSTTITVTATGGAIVGPGTLSNVLSLPPLTGAILGSGNYASNDWFVVSTGGPLPALVTLGNSPTGGTQIVFSNSGTVALTTQTVGTIYYIYNYSSSTNISVSGANGGTFVLQPYTGVVMVDAGLGWFPLAAPSASTIAVITTVACSTSGNAYFSQPIQGANDKKVLIRLSACLGTASYTYPTAFTNTPDSFIGGTASGASISSISTTAVTVTGATSTGAITLESY